ncbi:hypothetical protein HH214_01550 [Mucilaginibacter robiniae]|uniref:Uncharacterized protein n=1 Tax=Mucilaginibacter robiniae TaxID=2728022 RepID=A0A7L5E2S7_9SPHI|nr:hypothetical protein [Mucilaginibacter robiniae]QJD94646.1 hypothetical protein HH214_01550 [Mucilaginibacter robiniae]
MTLSKLIPGEAGYIKIDDNFLNKEAKTLLRENFSEHDFAFVRKHHRLENFRHPGTYNIRLFNIGPHNFTIHKFKDEYFILVYNSQIHYLCNCRDGLAECIDSFI